MNSELIKKAIKFAKNAHEGQVRKYTGEPYINHPMAVSRYLKLWHSDSTDEMVSAAILHDTVEDTEASNFDIFTAFGSEVAILVGWLTDVSCPKDGNRAARKLKDRVHTGSAPFEAQLIKCADLIHNSQSIIRHDESFAKVYLKEKRLTLDLMSDKTKNSAIFAVASIICDANNFNANKR
jgi:(p)ppGpp synthase/HD superfamily hydrolase